MTTRREGLSSTLSLWVAAFVGMDLGSKWLANLIAGDTDRWIITPRVNDELALGVASGQTHPMLLVVIAAVALSVFGHAIQLYLRGAFPAMGLASLLAGAAANAIDRLLTGGVHDWLRTGPIVINIADVLIVIGLVWYVVASGRATTASAQG